MATVLIRQLTLLVFMSVLVYGTSYNDISKPSTSLHDQMDHRTTTQSSVWALTPSSYGDNKIHVYRDDKGDDAVLDMIKNVQELQDNNEDSDEDSNGSANVLSHDDKLQNCSTEAVLYRYCPKLSIEVRAYFNYDLSVSGLLASIFRKDIVDALLTDCSPGRWCLPDSFHQDLMKFQSMFYSTSPFRSDTMWKCLKSMLDERLDCDEKKLKFLVSVVALLDDLEEVGEQKLNSHCFARTLEALYVTYADLLKRGGSPATHEQKECSGFNVEMTKTYHCANDVCNVVQVSVLKMFESWEGVVHTADKLSARCNINLSCQSPGNIIDYRSSTPKAKEEDTEGYDELEEMLEAMEGENADGEKKGSESASNEMNTDAKVDANNNKAVLFGMAVMTTVLMVGILGLAFLGYKRFCRARCGYEKCGYSNLVDEEANLLRAEYS
uniref:Uncharacterized protein n=1 Tax=Arion vulgaris TaxID=1028688 RepID=A0A0B7BAJ8_9EUPU